MQDTPIGWTNRSANPIRARNRLTGRRGWYCVRLGRECALCYAANINRRFGTGVDYLARHAGDVELYLDRRALRAVLRSDPANRSGCCGSTWPTCSSTRSRSGGSTRSWPRWR
jgi:hypothetical protein